jgi:hypothetical protein
MTTKKAFNPLLASPSPRDVPRTKEALQQIPYDKLWVKYYPENEAYPRIQDYFLRHKEYSHLVLCADDLLVEKQHFDALAKSVKADPQKYQVLSGVCNLDMVPGNEYILAVTTLFPPPNPRRHTSGFRYGFMDLRGRNYGRKSAKEEDKVPCPTGIEKVAFSGFPCMFISRSILERLTLRTDYEYNLQYKLPGSSVDTVFCWDCFNNGIDIYADFSVRMLHLRGWEDPSMELLVGKKEPTMMTFLTNKEKERQIVPIAVK